MTFTPTQWATSEKKALFFKQFQRFVSGGFKRSHFPKTFYRQLSNMFGHIAHYDQGGFYSVQCSTSARRVDFVRQALTYPCYGDSSCTYSDVELALQVWLREDGTLEHLEQLAAADLEGRERTELVRLQAKYN